MSNALPQAAIMLTRYCYFCVMDALFTPWLDDDKDLAPTKMLAKDCTCESLPSIHVPLSPPSSPSLTKPCGRKKRLEKKEKSEEKR